MGLAGAEGWAACLSWTVWELPGSQHLHFPGTMRPSLFGQARLGIQVGLGGMDGFETTEVAHTPLPWSLQAGFLDVGTPQG